MFYIQENILLIQKIKIYYITVTEITQSGVDPRIPHRRGRQHMILPNFCERLHEIEKILGRNFKSATDNSMETFILFNYSYLMPKVCQTYLWVTNG